MSAALDDRIAVLVAELEAKGAAYGVDTPEARRSIAVSVAIGRVAPPVSSGRRYDGLIGVAHNLAHGTTPGELARWSRLYGSLLGCQRRADDADRVADEIAASAADLRDDGATVAAWRAYATALRGAAS